MLVWQLSTIYLCIHTVTRQRNAESPFCYHAHKKICCCHKNHNMWLQYLIQVIKFCQTVGTLQKTKPTLCLRCMSSSNNLMASSAIQPRCDISYKTQSTCLLVSPICDILHYIQREPKRTMWMNINNATVFLSERVNLVFLSTLILTIFQKDIFISLLWQNLASGILHQSRWLNHLY